MNIQTLSDIVDLFKSEIVKTGFRRDIQDYTNSLPNNQNNIVTLRDIANKVYLNLDKIYNSDFPERMFQLLPEKKAKPFTDSKIYEQLSELINDSQIDQTQFFQKLHQIITQLNNLLIQNEQKIAEIENFIKPYIVREDFENAELNKAVVSIIFKESKTISSLNHFSKTIHAWNRTLPVYHQILKSSSPEDIQILEVQNGSIDFVFNFDFDIALNLIDLFKEGFKYYLAYLAYKNLAKPISQTFFGNLDLLKKQKELEDGMLENIEKAITAKINEQHIKAREHDKKLDDKIEKKVEEVTKLIASHIINGNDVRLLSLPKKDSKDAEENEGEELKVEIRQVSSEVRQQLKNLPEQEMKKLLDRYGKINENE